MTLQEAKNKIDILIEPYYKGYNGKQPIISNIDDRYLHIEKEFLDYLPLDISESISDIVNKSKVS